MGEIMRKVIVLAVAFAALVPAGASGRAAAQPATLFAGPFVLKGYRWTVVVKNGKRDTLTLIAVRQAGTSTQTHVYSFNTGVTFTPNATLSSAKLAAKLGRYGLISMTFTGKGGPVTAAPPPPCKGAAFNGRRGALAGRPGFSFRAASFFGKVVKATLSARLVRQVGAGDLDCGTSSAPSPTSGGEAGLTLTGLSEAAGEHSILTVYKNGAGEVREGVILVEDPGRSAPATVSHSITALTDSTAFTAAVDLSTATANGVAPFLTGTLTFTKSGGTGSRVTGTISGSFAARFDVPGTRTFNGLLAMLNQS